MCVVGVQIHAVTVCLDRTISSHSTGRYAAPAVAYAASEGESGVGDAQELGWTVTPSLFCEKVRPELGRT